MAHALPAHLHQPAESASLQRPGFVYQRREPELTALHKAIRQGWPQVRAAISERTGARLPSFVGAAAEAYLACGQLARGFARFRCAECRKDALVAFSCKVRGLCPSCDGKRMLEEAEHLCNSVLPQVPYRQWVLTLPYNLRYLTAWNVPLRNAILRATMRALARHYQAQARLAGLEGPLALGAISVAQRFSSDLKLNQHWHILLADGVWTQDGNVATFHPAPPLDTITVQEVLQDVIFRIDRQLERLGFKESEQPDTLAEQDPALAGLLKAALLGRPIELDGPLPERQKKTLLRLLPRPHGNNCAEFDGFSLHGNTRVGELARADLYRLVKYLCRPAIAAGRVTECDDGLFRVQLKTAWQDGTKAIKLSAADLTGRLLAVMPRPGRACIHYHFGFAPAAKIRPLIVLAGDKAPGRRNKKTAEHDPSELSDLSPEERLSRALQLAEQTSRRLSWSRALRLAFKVDSLACPCGGQRRLVALIERPVVVRKILAHLGLATQIVIKAEETVCHVRGPPQDIFPADLDELGNAVQAEPDVDEDPGFEFADELPEGDPSTGSGQALAA